MSAIPLPARRIRIAALLLLGLVAREASGQVVRGTITERTTGAPIPGALVTLEPAGTDADTSGSIDLSVLSGRDGKYAVQSARPGEFRLLVKRIGTPRYRSDPFALGPGQAIEQDVALEPISHSLPKVVVTSAMTCVNRGTSAPRLIALWDEARAAFAATAVTQRDTLVHVRLVRYHRALDPNSMRIQSESYYVAEGDGGLRFVALGADTLAKAGYWAQRDDGSQVFYAPDAFVLLSEAFTRDHCFGLTTGKGEHAGEVGIEFHPRSNRDGVVDIQGTVWLNESTLELRAVTFTWTNLYRRLQNRNVGGTVAFSQLTTGPWVVRRWYLRMPRAAPRETLNRFARVPAIMPSMLRLQDIVEDGGFIISNEIVHPGPPASISGTVRDSSNRPMRDVAVTLDGTEYRVRTDDRGRFRFDSLLAGVYEVHVRVPFYESIGVPAGDSDVVVNEGVNRTFSFRAANGAQIVTALCPDTVSERTTGALRITLVDTAATPMTGEPLRLQWQELRDVNENGRKSRKWVDQIRTDTADARGVALFCGLPPSIKLRLGIPLDSGGVRPLEVFQLRARGFLDRVVQVSGPS